MKIFNSQLIELNADDLRLMIIKKFMDQFDVSDHNAIEVTFVIDNTTKNLGLKCVRISGKSSMEI